MRPVEERFWSKVAIGWPDECWPWQASINGGYGQFRVRVGESPRKASRVSWWLTYGNEPGAKLVCHRCDNPPCCNPWHLFLGTVADNNADKMAKGRGPKPTDQMVIRFVERVRRLTDDQLHEALLRVSQGESCRSVARRFGCAHTTISRLVNGTQWKQLSSVASPTPRSS